MPFISLVLLLVQLLLATIPFDDPGEAVCSTVPDPLGILAKFNGVAAMFAARCAARLVRCGESSANELIVGCCGVDCAGTEAAADGNWALDCGSGTTATRGPAEPDEIRGDDISLVGFGVIGLTAELLWLPLLLLGLINGTSDGVRVGLAVDSLDICRTQLDGLKIVKNITCKILKL